MERNNVMLLYPPGALYQRGEDRSQGNIEDSSATAVRACNDLGYCAAVLDKKGYNVFLKDYQTERKTLLDVFNDIELFNPHLIMISVTNATIFEDLYFAGKLKSTETSIVLKGAIFYDPEQAVLDSLDLEQIDYLIGGEAETCISGIADYALRGEGDIASIDNILYKNTEGSFIKTAFHRWVSDLDTIPFPARQFMNNSLYIRPDTQHPMATIQTSRGCPARCVYCLSPIISGRSIRFRSPQNVMDELLDCYYNHNIKDFFFKADTFTFDAEWASDLCRLIIASPLNGKIQFTANSRTKPLSYEVLKLMKDAGCFAIALGFESGSDETLKCIKKGVTVADNLQAAEWCHKLNLKMYGFFMVGFPWESKEHLMQTKKHIYDINADFIELHIALPYYGTELYSLCKENGLLTTGPLGSSYFDSNTSGTNFVSHSELITFRENLIKGYYLRPSYIVKRLGDCISNPYIFINYAKYGIRILAGGKKK